MDNEEYQSIVKENGQYDNYNNETLTPEVQNNNENVNENEMENENGMENENEMGNEKDKDIVFNRLKHLQTLLKKESALKELFIKTSNETKKNFEEQCREIYKKKIDVFLHLNKLDKNNNDEKLFKKFELIDQISEHLKDLSNYIPKLLKYLWEDPKMMKNLFLI